jgi:hypothetical protein
MQSKYAIFIISSPLTQATIDPEFGQQIKQMKQISYLPAKKSAQSA